MSETYTVSAKTVDEAIDLASKLYGGRNKEISHEIVSLPKKGFLGFGSKDAVIRVTVTEAEDVGLSSIVSELRKYKDQPANETKAEAKVEVKTEAKAEKTEAKPHQKKKPQPKADKPAENKQTKSDKPQPKAEKPAEKVEAKTEKAEAKPQQKKKPQTKAEKPAEKVAPKIEAKAEPKAEAPANDVKIKTAVSRDEMNFAIDFVNTMIGNMNLSAQV